jgi:predicted oxidoreductase
MKSLLLGTSALSSSRLAYGCWRIAGGAGEPVGRNAVLAAYEAGYTLFDHADIYCDGEGERSFGRTLQEVPAMRDRVLIMTKCGICKPGHPDPASPYRYDFSAGHILRSCEGSLRRLGIETIDVFLLHRPDYLMDPAEVAGAFSQLKQQGKVREFGVSNFRPSQLAMLQKACSIPLIVNQVEISLANLNCLEDGTLDQCLTGQITPMAWSPLAGGKLGDGPRQILPSQEAYQTDAVRASLDEMAQARGASRTSVAIAWLLRHPARIIPVIGSTNPASIREAARADDIDLSRDEWYRLFRVARGQPLA